jgi:hypothetical protein
MAEARYFVQAMQMLDELVEMEGVELDGKLYALVKDRVSVFRQMFGGEYGIDTSVEWLPTETGVPMCMIRAEISDGHRIVAAGHSTGWPGKTEGIQEYVEMAETRAVGRALAMFGLGGDTLASADEMQNAKKRKASVVKMVHPVAKMSTVFPDVSDLLDKIKSADNTDVLTSVWVDIGNEPDDTRTKKEKSELRSAFTAKLAELNGED